MRASIRRSAGGGFGLAVLLLLLSPAWAQGPGFFLVAPGTGRPQCTSITSPVTNQTWCADGNPSYAWRVWNGSAYVPITGGGGGGDLTATYILQTPAGDLPNAQALSALSTGLLINTTGTGVLTTFTGAICPPGTFVDGITNTGGLACGAASGNIGGSGTINTLPKFTASTTLGNSTITDDGTTATLGSTNVKLANQVAGSGHTCLQVDTTGVITQTGLPCASGFSGTVTISGSNTTGAVVFSSTQPDTTYTVTLGTRGNAGTPPAVVADYKSKATTGFTVEISAPPGGGNSIDVDWQIGSGNFTFSGGGGVTGSGTTGTIPLWTGSTSLGNSHLTDNGTLITSSENIVPSADHAKDLGSTTVAWQTIFAKGNAGVSDNRSAVVLGSAPTNVTTNGSANGLLTLQTKFYTFGIADLMLNDGDGPMTFMRSNGTYAAPTAVTNGADAGTILFTEWNGSSFVTAASVQGVSAVASGPAYGGRLTMATGITSGGFNIWTLDEFGRIQQATSTFVNLTAGSPTNGMFAYCSDCDPPAAFNATCSSSGTKTGAWAVRIHATWFCVAG